jgi:hypothetical protein
MLYAMDIRPLRWAACAVLGFWLGACAAGEDRAPGHDDGHAGQAGALAGAGAGAGADAGGGGDASGTSRALVFGCREEPLILGEVSDPELAGPQVVWTGTAFAVGWGSADGYRIRITNGSSTSNSAELAGTPVSAHLHPQLFWSNDRLELYYGLSESIFVDAFDSALKVVDTRMIGFGSFHAVQMASDRIAVLTPTAFYLDGMETMTPYNGSSAGGWNGRDFLTASVLGHGSWVLEGLSGDGTRQTAAVELQWCGSCGTTGRAGGSAFASSADAGRHAVVIAADRSLTVALEGRPVIERELFAEKSDAAMLWDGERYLVLLADRLRAGDADSTRDIVLLTSSIAGELELAAQQLLGVSEHSSDERFPAAAAAKPGDYGIAWVRGGELAFQRCSLVERAAAR